jgi:putative peptidoglycan lipid II flippase
MIVGQLANLAILKYSLTGYRIHIFNFNFSLHPSKKFFLKYGQLILIAIFSSSFVPLNTYIASSLGAGAISIFNLGIKFSLFLIAIMSVIFTTILLPYLSKISFSKNKSIFHRETFHTIFLSSAFFVPFALFVSLNSDLFTSFIFRHIITDEKNLLQISDVIRFSIIQLPFWIFNAIIYRHANIINKLFVIIVSNFLILLLNFYFAIHLIKHFKIGGVALSMTLSLAAASVFLLLYYVKKKYMSISEASIILVFWLIFYLIFTKIIFIPLLY